MATKHPLPPHVERLFADIGATLGLPEFDTTAGILHAHCYTWSSVAFGLIHVYWMQKTNTFQLSFFYDTKEEFVESLKDARAVKAKLRAFLKKRLTREQSIIANIETNLDAHRNRRAALTASVARLEPIREKAMPKEKTKVVTKPQYENKSGYEGKQLDKFLAFCKRKFVADLKACFLGQDIKAKIGAEVMLDKGNAIFIDATDVLRNPSFKKEFRLMFVVDVLKPGNNKIVRDFEFRVTAPLAPDFEDAVDSGFENVNIDSMDGRLYGNAGKNAASAAIYLKQCTEHEEFNTRIVDVLKAFAPTLKTRFEEFERTQ